MNTINEFKEASELIYAHRREIKNEMDNLSKNLYSSLNQLNFSVKLIVDANNFISKYVNSEVSILQKLTTALTTPYIETTINMYDNVAFNNLFISSVIFFENFSKILMESVSHYLIDAIPTDTRSLRAMYEQYCTDMFIKNDWLPYKYEFEGLYNNYRNIFSIPNILDEALMTSTQSTLFNQYLQYQTIFNNLSKIFIEGDITQFTFTQIDEEIIPAIQGIINFKSGSTLYDRYTDKMGNILNETIALLKRIWEYANVAIEHNIELQPQFKTEDSYIATIINVCTISSDLLSMLIFKYPNKQTRQGLILDGNFNKVLTTINNLLRKEIETASTLIDIVSKDYKFIKSLESFITTEKSLDNKQLFRIMSNFDKELALESNGFKLSSLIRLYFDETGISGDAFGDNSFTTLLAEAMILTDPLYDILNYYRLFLYPFSQDLTLIFDFLETLHIFNISLTNQEFNTAMTDLFEIKLKNIDYININESKINESITSRYKSLNNLNYFNITPYITKIKQTNTSTITNKTELTNLFKDLNDYNLILFALIENILYNNINIELLLQILSIKTNIRTSFFKLMFLIAMDKIITTIETEYTIESVITVPDNLTIYNDLIKAMPSFEQISEELDYLKLLASASDYYKGYGTIFNKDRITNFDSIIYDYIWDKDKIAMVKKLFSLYKEV